MRPTLKVNTMNLKAPKAVLLGTSALVCLALSAPVMADDFVITGSDNSTNGTGTTNGGTAAAIADTAINGSDTVSLGIALTTTGTNVGIKTNNNGTEAQSNTVTVTKTGSITTGTGNNAYGIFNDGAYNTTIVSGSIATGTGNSAHGIRNDGNNNTTTVSGSIATKGWNSDGIYNDGNNNTTTISGSITLEGIYAYGIYNRGDSNTTTVAGSIKTGTGNDAYGIRNDGNNNTTTISGSIKTGGNYADGIWNEGSTNTTTVSGSITTGGNNAYGIFNRGSTNTTTVSGSIATGGRSADGIFNDGNNNTTTISGSITTKGIYADGIRNDGNNNTTTISGTVKATGAKSAALYNYSGSGNSFTLNEGATIIGDILAEDATGTVYDATNSKLIFNLGASTSYAYSVSGKGEGTGGGQWDFSDLDGRSQVVTTTGTGCDTTMSAGNDTCNLVTAVGAANAEVQNELQYITSTSLINSLRLDTPVNTSQEETTATDVWFDAYGVSTERDASTWDTTGVVFNADTRGLTIGKPLVLGDSFGLDLVFNTSQTDLDVGATKHQNIAAQSFNFGVVMTDLASSSNWDVDAFGFIGRNSYEGKRKVMNNQVSTGSETVTSSYSGTKALVGFDVDYTTPINEAVSFKGGINANLSNEKIGAYSESKYSTWNARTVSQAASGISAGLTHKRDLLSTFVTLGAEYSSLLSGEKASYTNNGTATSYTDHDASDDMISSVAVGFKYAGTNGVSFEGAIKGSSSNKGLTSTSANLGLNWAF